MSVAPHAGAWIETAMSAWTRVRLVVAPHAGAWIETVGTWERLMVLSVAPHAGAWIETWFKDYRGYRHWTVAPHAGAWIETEVRTREGRIWLSHPMRVRGLKHT